MYENEENWAKSWGKGYPEFVNVNSTLATYMRLKLRKLLTLHCMLAF